ncbi:MAG: glycosyltransferase family A protein, partial [Candidatus Omnitrophota bacterium]
MPKVSVIIPTYNRAHFLQRAIECVLKQTFSDWELLVVDNGSTDDTEPLVHQLQKKDARIRYLFEKRKGLSHARNLGFKEARGEFIVFLDDDDEWEPEKIKKQTAALESNPEIALVTCGGWRINELGEVIDEIPRFGWTPSFKSLAMEGCGIPSPSSVMIRRSCLWEVGVFSTKYCIASDYDLYLRITDKYSALCIPEHLY